MRPPHCGIAYIYNIILYMRWGKIIISDLSVPSMSQAGTRTAVHCEDPTKPRRISPLTVSPM